MCKYAFIILFLCVTLKCEAQFTDIFFDYVPVSMIDSLDEARLTYREIVFDEFFPEQKYQVPVIDEHYKCDSLQGYRIAISGEIHFSENSTSDVKIPDSVAVRRIFVLHKGLIMSMDKIKIYLRQSTKNETIPLEILFYFRNSFLKKMKYSKYFISPEFKSISLLETYIIE